MPDGLDPVDVIRRRAAEIREGTDRWPVWKSGPGAANWPDDVVAWCQTCDTGIKRTQEYHPVPVEALESPGLRGFAHAHCPPQLTVVQ